jgi:S-adenosylmethionine synthetase
MPSQKLLAKHWLLPDRLFAGEVKSKAYLDVQEIARGVIRKIGYTKSEYMFEATVAVSFCYP